MAAVTPGRFDGTTANQGIYLHSGASLDAGGSGNLDLDGQGGDGSSSNDGIFFSPGSSASVDEGDLTQWLLSPFDFVIPDPPS